MKNGCGIVGSKAAMGAAQRIVSELPPHRIYIETFAGSGAVGRLKRRCELDVFIERDIDTASRLRLAIPDCQVVVGDCTRVIVPESIPEYAVVYADPPYLMSVRKSARKYYRFELSTDQEHERLLAWLKRFRCPVLVSGYRSELYEARLPGWRLETFNVATRSGVALECLWCNFPAAPERHDTRFMGAGFRERERIRRKASRWARKIRAMPPGERAAVLAALADNAGAVSPAVPSFQVMKASSAPLAVVADPVPQLVLL